jgi:hypothetical protein
MAVPIILPGLLTLTGLSVVPDKLRESNLKALRLSGSNFGEHDKTWSLWMVETWN